MSCKAEVGESLKRCSYCHAEKPLNCFYKMGLRTDSRCKECIKKIRAHEYRKKKDLPPHYAKGRITKVIVKEIPLMSPEQYKREMEAVEVILENLIYKVLSKRMPKGGAHE